MDSQYIAYSFIIGGAAGNLYDRIFYGYVIDFIEFHYNSFYWPIFNKEPIFNKGPTFRKVTGAVRVETPPLVPMSE